MKPYRRLRRLAPDEQLVRRRAGGEPLRPLASDYHVSHTTLSRYFARPAVANEIKQTQRLPRAETKARLGAPARRAPDPATGRRGRPPR